MAGELRINSQYTGLTLYAMLLDRNSQVWDTTGTPAFETYATAQIANYDIALTEQGTASKRYVGDFPAVGASGYYDVEYYIRDGGSPAETDELIGTESGYWNNVSSTWTPLNNNIAAPGDEMDLVDAPNSTALDAISAAIEAAILDEGDATALLAAISAKVEEFLINDGDSTATLSAIATAVTTAIGNGSGLTEAGGTGDHLTAIPKTGYKLASDGLDSITATTPNGVASTFTEKMNQLWARFFGRVTKDSDEIKTYRSDGTTVATTQTYTSSGDDDDVGAAS